MTQTPQTPPTPPAMLSYREPPKGEVVASDAALKAMRKTRTWALLCAIGMFVYGVIGGLLGVAWLIVAIRLAGNPNEGKVEFVILVPPNLILPPLALIGGWLAMRYRAAAGRAYAERSAEALERAMITQWHIWCWAALTASALLALPFVIVGIGFATGVFR